MTGRVTLGTRYGTMSEMLQMTNKHPSLSCRYSDIESLVQTGDAIIIQSPLKDQYIELKTGALENVDTTDKAAQVCALFEAQRKLFLNNHAAGSLETMNVYTRYIKNNFIVRNELPDIVITEKPAVALPQEEELAFPVYERSWIWDSLKNVLGVGILAQSKQPQFA